MLSILTQAAAFVKGKIKKGDVKNKKRRCHFHVAFELNGGVFAPPEQYKDVPVLVILAPPVTSQPTVNMTLEAYNADGTILGKSHMVELQFGKSVQGVPADFPSGSVTRVTFTPSTWQGDPPDLYILIPASEHKRGIFARVTTAGALQSGGAYASALPCWERQINGDILLKSDTPVSGEIFIERGN